MLTDYHRASFNELFTEEEKGLIRQFLADRQYDNIAAVVVLDTPKKEEIIEAYINHHRPVASIKKSKVREKIEEMEMHGEIIDTPQKEAEFQRALNEEEQSEEVKEKKEKTKEVKEELEAESKDEPKEEPKESEKPKRGRPKKK